MPPRRDVYNGRAAHERICAFTIRPSRALLSHPCAPGVSGWRRPSAAPGKLWIRRDVPDETLSFSAVLATLMHLVCPKVLLRDPVHARGSPGLGRGEGGRCFGPRPMMAEDSSSTPLDYSFLDSIPHTYRLLASGGVAGCVAKTATAPLSRLTILFQVSPRDPRKSAVMSAGSLRSPSSVPTWSVLTIASPGRAGPTMQVHSALPGGMGTPYAQGLWPALRKVFKDEGILAFWKVRQENKDRRAGQYEVLTRCLASIRVPGERDKRAASLSLHGDQLLVLRAFQGAARRWYVMPCRLKAASDRPSERQFT
jgi:hypothetical protein